MLDFKNFKFLTVEYVKKIKVHQCANNSSKSLELWSRYGDFSIFQDGGHRYLGFSKFEIFKVCNGQEGRAASPCKIPSKSFEICEYQYYASLA